MDIVLQRVTTVPELKRCAELERLVWGGEPIPLHQTVTAAKNGGIVIGAYAGTEMVGFVYSFAGFAGGETYLCSHMMGIVPAYRNQGLGARLKLAQAATARQIGYRLIRWTYDPLESRNAFLNIAKLGAICSDYIENCYGEMEDDLNRGLPSDRFHVEWLINSPHVQERQAHAVTAMPEEQRCLLGWRLRADGFPQAVDRGGDGGEAGPFFVPVPLQFQEMKKADHALAVEWRLQTRRVFQDAFARGLAVAVIVQPPAEPVQYYVLVRREELALAQRVGMTERSESR